MQKANSVIHEAGTSQHRRRLRVYHLIMWATKMLFRHQSCSTSRFWCLIKMLLLISLIRRQCWCPHLADLLCLKSRRPSVRDIGGRQVIDSVHVVFIVAGTFLIIVIIMESRIDYSWGVPHICATTVPNAREYVSKRQVIDIGIGRSPGINKINFYTENIDQSIAPSLHQSWQQFHSQMTNGK